jgi:hypothetical protein
MTKKQSTIIRVFFAIIIVLLLLLNIEEVRTFIVAFIIRVIAFIERNIITMLMSFLLVKGKFVWIVFLKKMTILSISGLGKRYLTEKVFLHHIKVNLLTPLKKDIKILINYVKDYFVHFTIIKKVISVVVFLSSLSYIAKSMGIFLAIRVVLAKIWSFLLAFFIKISSAFLYFFTDYLWNSWITPILEIFIFSWFFSLMEKVPVLNRFLQKIYNYFTDFFEAIESVLQKIFHIPIKKVMDFLVKKTRLFIVKFIGIPYKAPFQKLKDIHKDFPNLHTRLKIKRAKRKSDKNSKKYVSAFNRLKNKRLK